MPQAERLKDLGLARHELSIARGAITKAMQYLEVHSGMEQDGATLYRVNNHLASVVRHVYKQWTGLSKLNDPPQEERS